MYSQVRGQTQTPVWPLQQMLEVNKVTTISLPRYLYVLSCFKNHVAVFATFLAIQAT